MPDLQILKTKVKFHYLLVLLTPFCYDSLEGVLSEPALVPLQHIFVLQACLASRAFDVLSSRGGREGLAGQREGSEATAHPHVDFLGHSGARASAGSHGFCEQQ